jgi:photosystem II stability/assembly factor-like uncharacterized protein
VDPDNTNVIYALSQGGNLGKSTDNGATFNGATNGISNGDRKNWDTPITFDPGNSQILYYGANRLYKSTNAAANWTAISPDLTDGPYSGNLTFGTIISVSVSPIHSDLIYVGTDDGNVWVTQNGGTTWGHISGTLPNRWVTKVLASREDLNGVYVTLSGYRYGEDNGHVYKSSNYGASWTDISSGLPDIPVNDIEQDLNGNLYLGTDIGVIASGNQGANWEVLGDNMPSVVVTDLHIHEASQYLYAATYGRSSYKLDLSAVVLGSEEIAFNSQVVIYPNPASDVVTISMPVSSEKISVKVYDQLGRQLIRKDFSEEKTLVQLSTEAFPQGLYYLKITQGSSQTTQKLLIK